MPPILVAGNRDKALLTGPPLNTVRLPATLVQPIASADVAQEAVFDANQRPLTSAYAREREACPSGCQVVVLDIEGLSPFAYASATVSPGQGRGSRCEAAP